MHQFMYIKRRYGGIWQIHIPSFSVKYFGWDTMECGFTIQPLGSIVWVEQIGRGNRYQISFVYREEPIQVRRWVGKNITINFFPPLPSTMRTGIGCDYGEHNPLALAIEDINACWVPDVQLHHVIFPRTHEASVARTAGTKNTPTSSLMRSVTDG